MSGESIPQTAEQANPPAGPRRWLCRCATPPFLLATLEGGSVNLKFRDRYYHIEGLCGRIRAICPRCGQQHTLDLANAECGVRNAE